METKHSMSKSESHTCYENLQSHKSRQVYILDSNRFKSFNFRVALARWHSPRNWERQHCWQIELQAFAHRRWVMSPPNLQKTHIGLPSSQLPTRKPHRHGYCIRKSNLGTRGIWLSIHFACEVLVTSCFVSLAKEQDAVPMKARSGKTRRRILSDVTIFLQKGASEDRRRI